MNEKLNKMMKKSSFTEFRLTENGGLEMHGRSRQVLDNYFLYDGKHYYFGNPFVRLSSATKKHGDLVLAMTDTKMLIPQDCEEYRYIARNHQADRGLLVIALYYHEEFYYCSVVSGSGSGRVHTICMPFTKEGFIFCFHWALQAIATVDPELSATLFTSIQQKTHDAKVKVLEQSSESSDPEYMN